jgi:hypothetical protein
MDADDCEALVAAVLAECDSPASRRLVLDAWGAADRAVALRTVLSGVRAYAAHGRALAGIGATGGEVRGVQSRPVGVACWWLGERVGKTKTVPLTGWVKAGERLPAGAKFWCEDGAGWWFRLPKGG